MYMQTFINFMKDNEMLKLVSKSVKSSMYKNFKESVFPIAYTIKK